METSSPERIAGRRISRALHNAGIAIAIAILAATGAIKLIAAKQDDRILVQQDPLLHLDNATLFVLAGTAELIVAILLLTPIREVYKLGILAWLVGAFSLYRVGHFVSGLGAPCPCLGTGLGWWPWLEKHNNGAALGAYVALCVIVVMWALSYGYARRR